MNTNKFIKQCPECGGDIEVQDTHGISYISFCDNCGYEDKEDYFLNTHTGVFELMLPEEAERLGSFSSCPKCGERMEDWERRKYGVCIFCTSIDSKID